ncbi:MAG: hypothetical protein F6K09_38060 [Merismopedia sp. SIO2A8]|nr:hypothetical protein [Symploca sp. SIO2B6]NET54213.1 hypothetical protein [Merismopedia sp. SIO2A8]
MPTHIYDRFIRGNEAIATAFSLKPPKHYLGSPGRRSPTIQTMKGEV